MTADEAVYAEGLEVLVRWCRAYLAALRAAAAVQAFFAGHGEPVPDGFTDAAGELATVARDFVARGHVGLDDPLLAGIPLG